MSANKRTVTEKLMKNFAEMDEKCEEDEVVLMEALNDEDPNEKAMFLTVIEKHSRIDLRDMTLRMIKSVQKPHSIGLLHRNLEPRYFIDCPVDKRMKIAHVKGNMNMQHKSSHSCSLTHENYKECDKYVGTLNYAPFEVLEHLSGQRQEHIYVYLYLFEYLIS